MTASPMQRPVVVPSLDELDANPALFDDLPRPAQEAVYEQVAVLEARLRAKWMAQHGQHPRPSGAPERVVKIEEAAERLGMTQDFLYRRWRKLDLGAYRDDDRHLKFPLSGIERHIQRKARR